MADYFPGNPGLDKGEGGLGRYPVMEIDDKIIMEELNKLISMRPKIMIHRILRKDHKMIKLVLKYKWRYLTIIGEGTNYYVWRKELKDKGVIK